MGACLGKLNAVRANAKDKSKSKTDEKATAKAQPAETTADTTTQAATTKDVQQSVTDATTTEEQSTSDTKTPVKEAPPTDITASTDGKEETSKPVESTDESAKASPEKAPTSDKVDTEASTVEAKSAEAAKHDALPADEQAPSIEKLQIGFSVLMAGTLEAVRAGIADCDEVASSGVLRNLIVSFSDLTLATKNEMVIEEEAYFPLLDENFDDVAKNAKLYEAHRADELLEAKVDEALREKQIEDATAAFAEWKQHHLDHIDRELEAVASPLASLASKVGEDRLPAMLNERILSSHMDDMPWFVSWNCAMLAKHKPFDSLATWVTALQSISTPAQWKKLLPAVYTPLSEDTREQLRQIGADQPGKVA